MSLNVLLLSNAAHVGGGNTSVRLLARGLVASGHQVTIAVPARGEFTDSLDSEDVRTVVVENYDRRRSTPFRNHRADRQAAALLERLDVSVVHSNGLARATQFAKAARRQEVPVVCHLRFPVTRSYAQWKLTTGRFPNLVIYNSLALSREIQPYVDAATGGVVPSKVIYNAIDLDEYRRADSLDTQRIAVIANFHPVKGHQTFLEALALLAKRGLQPECLLIGRDVQDSGCEQSLRQQVTELGLSHVKFLGYRKDVPELLRSCSLLVCPSYVEPFGRCLIEAMAAGLPVIGTKVGGIPEVLDQGSAGMLVPAQDASALAAGIERLLTSKSERYELAERGWQRVRDQFSIDSHTRQVLACYQDLLQRTNVSNASSMS